MGKHRKSGCGMFVLAFITGGSAGIWALGHYVVPLIAG